MAFPYLYIEHFNPSLPLAVFLSTPHSFPSRRVPRALLLLYGGLRHHSERMDTPLTTPEGAAERPVCAVLPVQVADLDHSISGKHKSLSSKVLCGFNVLL